MIMILLYEYVTEKKCEKEKGMHCQVTTWQTLSQIEAKMDLISLELGENKINV